MVTKIKKFILEARQELRQVQWPSREEAIYLTSVVVGISLMFAVFLGAFDYLFSYLLKVFITRT